MGKARQYIMSMPSESRLDFTTEQISKDINISRDSAQKMTRRLRKNGFIVTPYRSFHIIKPSEFGNSVDIPVFYYIDQLMKNLQEPYYVGLLSAAELHGAAHQRPQTFQVMTGKNRPKIIHGSTHIHFIARKDMTGMPVQKMNTARGTINVATPELTAFELMGYPNKAGGLSNAATVLVDLAESIDAMKLGKVALLQPMAWVQRLGYVLDFIGRNSLNDFLVPLVRKDANTLTPLLRSADRKGCVRDRKWKLIVNTELEPDI